MSNAKLICHVFADISVWINEIAKPAVSKTFQVVKVQELYRAPVLFFITFKDSKTVFEILDFRKSRGQNLDSGLIEEPMSSFYFLKMLAKTAVQNTAEFCLAILQFFHMTFIAILSNLSNIVRTLLVWLRNGVNYLTSFKYMKIIGLFGNREDRGVLENI